MRKLLKKLFSRAALVSLLILAQLGLIIYFIYWGFNFNSVFVWIFLYIISTIICLYIIQKDEMPEFKLPWIVTVLLLPGFGVVLYFLFGHLSVSHKYRKSFKDFNDKIHNILLSKKENAELKNIDLEAYQLLSYVENVARTPFYSNSIVKYFKIGEDFLPVFLDELRKATKYIYLEYYIISNGKAWNSILQILKEKVKQGIEVRVIYDDIGSMLGVKYGYPKYLESLGIKAMAFNRYRPIISSVYNNRDHRKITIIDGEVGFTGGINLSDEYFNMVKVFGVWKDNAIMIKGEGVKSLLGMFLMMWASNSKYPKDDLNSYFSKKTQVIESEGYIQPYADGPKPLYKEKVSRNVYLNMINNSKKYLYISTPYLVCDYSLTEALINAKKRGVDVRILLPGIPDKKIIYNLSKLQAHKLFKEGVKIYSYLPGFNHAKTFVSDDKYACCGTINLDYRSLVHNFECGTLIVLNNDCIKNIKEDFLEMFNQSKLMGEKEFKTNIVLKVILSFISIFSPLF